MNIQRLLNGLKYNLTANKIEISCIEGTGNIIDRIESNLREMRQEERQKILEEIYQEEKLISKQ